MADAKSEQEKEWNLITMIGLKDAARLHHATAYDRTGHKIGKVEQLYVDGRSQQPSWITIATGLFGTSESFVPLQGAELDGNDVRVAFDKDTVKDAPRIEADGVLEPQEEQRLFQHYHMTMTSPEDEGAGQRSPHAAGHAEAKGRKEEDHAMTLSEERLKAGKETIETGTARLRKYTTTETQTVEVPVRKEKLVVERTPATGKGSGRPIEDRGEQAEEITLHEERAVVSKETVPVEEVHVSKTSVTETETVKGEVRKEHADIDVDQDRRRK